MAIVLKDRVKETANAPGTGTITLTGASAGFQAFSAVGNGNVTYFAITDVTTGAWEVNYGTYTASGTTLTRNATPLSSSNAGALVNFTNAVEVFCTYPSGKAIYEEVGGNVIFDGGPITVVGNNVSSYTSFSNFFAEMFGNANTYMQVYVENQNGGSEASADYVAVNDIGSDTTYYVDMGINSSGYSSATYQIYTPNSGYVYSIGGGSTSKMFVGSGDSDLILHAGGFLTTNIAATISGTTQTFAIAKDATVGGTLGVTGAATFGSTVTLNADPAANLQAATKQYVDQKASTGLSYHAAVQAATTQSLAAQTGGTVTYNQPGGAGVGVGATITLSVALTTLDGYSLSNTNRILVKNESNQTYNGVYTWATGGTVLTRATDADTAGGGANELSLNDYFYVQNGTVNRGIAYVVSSPSTAIVFGSSNIQFAEFSSAQVYTGTSPINVSSTVISLTTVPATLGGTGVATVATGDLLYGSGANTWSKLTKGSAYQPLVMDASGTNVQWNAIALNQSNAVSGVLPETYGGTNQNTYALGDMLYSSAANTLSKLAGNTTTTKKFLVQTGTGSVSDAPLWGTISGSDVSGNITGQAGSVANSLTAGTYLTGTAFNGSAAQTWTVDATSANTASKVVARDASGDFSAGTITATLSGAATSATTATNLAGGAANRIAYQTGAGATSFITAASGTNFVLNFDGAAFNWVSGSISGVSLGNNLYGLTAGSYLTSSTSAAYTGAAVTTFNVDATSANTASKVVARDSSGDFSAGTITAALIGNASTATSLAGGGAGQLPYNTSSGVTNFLAAGTTGQVLLSNGTSAPSWGSVNGGTF